MKVNTASWHYRVLKWLGSTYGKWWEPPSSLCSYFWSFPGYLIRFIFMSLIIGLCVSYMPISLYAWLHNGSHECKVLFLGTLALVSVIFVIGWTCILVDNSRYSSKSTFLYLVREWVRAKKNRVCPLLTYVTSDVDKKE